MLGREEFVALVPAALAAELGSRRLTITSLAKQPLITTPTSTATRRQVDEAFAAAGAAMKIAVETDHRESIVPLVTAGAGIAILPRACGGVRGNRSSGAPRRVATHRTRHRPHSPPDIAVTGCASVPRARPRLRCAAPAASAPSTLTAATSVTSGTSERRQARCRLSSESRSPHARADQEVRMRVHVDGDKCQGHNRCYSLAPELFDVDDLGYAHEIGDGNVPAELEEQRATRRHELPRARDRADGGAMKTERPLVTDWSTDFDHTDPQWVADPFPIWDELRQTCPGRAQRPLRRHVATRAPRRRRRGRLRHRALHLAVGHRQRAAARAATTCPRRSASHLRSPPTHRSMPWRDACCCPRSARR